MPRLRTTGSAFVQGCLLPRRYQAEQTPGDHRAHPGADGRACRRQGRSHAPAQRRSQSSHADLCEGFIGGSATKSWGGASLRAQVFEASSGPLRAGSPLSSRAGLICHVAPGLRTCLRRAVHPQHSEVHRYPPTLRHTRSASFGKPSQAGLSRVFLECLPFPARFEMR